MKSLIAIAAIATLIAPTLASAQTATPPVSAQSRPLAQPSTGGVAAATLPNSFDAPATTQPAPSTTPRPAPAGPASTAPVADAETVAATETALKKTIAAAQNGTLNYADMTDSLASQIRGRADTVVPLIQGFGALQAVEHAGSQDGMELFLVTFEDAVTQWMIGLDADEKIVGLLFRPADTTPAAAPAK